MIIRNVDLEKTLTVEQALELAASVALDAMYDSVDEGDTVPLGATAEAAKDARVRAGGWLTSAGVL